MILNTALVGYRVSNKGILAEGEGEGMLMEDNQP